METELGLREEMAGMVMTFDRDDHPGMVTGDRYRYRLVNSVGCPNCDHETDLVIDYLGKLYFICRDCRTTW